MSAEASEAFESQGFIPPFRLPDFGDAEITRIIHAGAKLQKPLNEYFRSGGTWESYFQVVMERLPWIKSGHAFSPEICRVAAHPALLQRIVPLIGKDVLLWGAQVIAKRPGDAHRWHVDVETLAWRSVNVWIGLKNVTRDCGLKLIGGSQKLEAPQFLAETRSFSLLDDEQVVAAAREALGESAMIQRPPVGAGDVLIFHGRVWHASKNDTDKIRVALLLQYSPTSAVVRIPTHADPPVRWHATPPPCLLVCGHNSFQHNHMVSPPPSVGPPRARP